MKLEEMKLVSANCPGVFMETNDAKVQSLADSLAIQIPIPKPPHDRAYAIVHRGRWHIMVVNFVHPTDGGLVALATDSDVADMDYYKGLLAYLVRHELEGEPEVQIGEPK